MTKLLYRISGRLFLVLALLGAFVPFLDQRVLRMAGDEKVYVSTAIEMARNNNWFVQRLADEPNYFKGPMHYLFMRAGLLTFGDRLVAGLWMNAFLAILAGLAMYQLGRRRWDDRTGLLLGFATGLNVGLFSHALASQMEVEVYAFYAFAVAALGLARGKRDFWHDLLFWVSAGLAGWSKSPVHSVLISTGGLCYWTWTRQLGAKLTHPGAWIAALIGVAVGAGGYAPLYLLDRENFLATYVMREQFEKANNQRSWRYVIEPLFYFLLPWTFITLGGLGRVAVDKWKRFRRKSKAIPPRPANNSVALPSAPGLGQVDWLMLKLGVAMAAPTILMWTTWSYKGQNYNLPALPALILVGFACYSGSFPRWVFRATGVIGGLTLACVVGLIAHFWPLPEWWNLYWLGAALAGIVVFIFAFSTSEDFRVLGVGAMALFIAFGAFITPLGEREMRDIRQFLRVHPEAELHYYNLDPSIWSEWGLLQLTLHRPVYGLHRKAQLPQATKPGSAVLVQSNEALNVVMSHWRNKPDAQKGKAPSVITWARWLTKGKTPEGKSRWREAWISRDLRFLEREFFIIWFPK